MSLARPKEYSTLGNMPLKEEGVVMAEDENYLLDHYKKSVIMSTYLLKWVVSKYSYAEALTRRGILVRLVMHLFWGEKYKDLWFYTLFYIFILYLYSS